MYDPVEDYANRVNKLLWEDKAMDFNVEMQIKILLKAIDNLRRKRYSSGYEWENTHAA